MAVAFRSDFTPGSSTNNKGFRVVLGSDNVAPEISSSATVSVSENTEGVVHTGIATDNFSAAGDIVFSLAAKDADKSMFKF